MYIRLGLKAKRGFTLPEMMMAVGVFSLSGLALMGLWLYCIRGFGAMYNYALLDQCNRQAMDQMTREVRQARQVIDCSSNSITVLTANLDGSPGPQVTYMFNPIGQTLVRTSTDGTTKVLLQNCNLLNFNLYTRCPSNAVFGIFPAATSNWQQTVKVIQLSWKTSITTPTCVGTSEDVQTARIVIRKQQD
jgi:prepilin-type N-terminal cleavage/methylation domain-containing protein